MFLPRRRSSRPEGIEPSPQRSMQPSMCDLQAVVVKGSGRGRTCVVVRLLSCRSRGTRSCHLSRCRGSRHAADPRSLSRCHGLHASRPPSAAVSHGPGVDVSNRSLRSTFHRFRSMLLVHKAPGRIRTCARYQFLASLIACSSAELRGLKTIRPH